MALYGTPFVDLSGAITLGGTAQTFAPADSARRYLRICNPSAASESLWVNDKGASASSSDGMSFELPPGTVFVWPTAPSTAVSIVCATTAHTFEGAQG